MDAILGTHRVKRPRVPAVSASRSDLLGFNGAVDSPMTKPARETMWSEGDVGGERANGLFKATFKALPRWWNRR